MRGARERRSARETRFRRSGDSMLRVRKRESGGKPRVGQFAKFAGKPGPLGRLAASSWLRGVSHPRRGKSADNLSHGGTRESISRTGSRRYLRWIGGDAITANSGVSSGPGYFCSWQDSAMAKRLGRVENVAFSAPRRVNLGCASVEVISNPGLRGSRNPPRADPPGCTSGHLLLKSFFPLKTLLSLPLSAASKLT